MRSVMVRCTAVVEREYVISDELYDELRRGADAYEPYYEDDDAFKPVGKEEIADYGDICEVYDTNTGDILWEY